MKIYVIKQIEKTEYALRSIPLRLLTWNTILPVLLCIIACIAAFLKRCWRWGVILCIPLGQITVLFIALTQSHQMFAMTYYWPAYILAIIAIKDILCTNRRAMYLQ